MSQYPNTDINRATVENIIDSLKNKSTAEIKHKLDNGLSFIKEFKANKERLDNFLKTGEGKNELITYFALCGLFKYPNDEDLVERVIDDYYFLLNH